jgi:hypothetical protein
MAGRRRTGTGTGIEDDNRLSFRRLTPGRLWVRVGKSWAQAAKKWQAGRGAVGIVFREEQWDLYVNC